MREVDAIIRLAELEMEEAKAGEKSPKKKSLEHSDRKESVYTLHKK